VFKKETIHRVSRHVIIPSTVLRLVSCIKREKPMRFFFFSSTFDFARAMCDARLSRQSMIPQNLRTGTAKEIISRSKVPAKGRQREDRKRNTHRERERERERGGGGPEEGNRMCAYVLSALCVVHRNCGKTSALGNVDRRPVRSPDSP